MVRHINARLNTLEAIERLAKINIEAAQLLFEWYGNVPDDGERWQWFRLGRDPNSMLNWRETPQGDRYWSRVNAEFEEGLVEEQQSLHPHRPNTQPDLLDIPDEITEGLREAALGLTNRNPTLDGRVRVRRPPVFSTMPNTSWEEDQDGPTDNNF